MNPFHKRREKQRKTQKKGGKEEKKLERVPKQWKEKEEKEENADWQKGGKLEAAPRLGQKMGKITKSRIHEKEKKSRKRWGKTRGIDKERLKKDKKKSLA